ncbi:LLM class flavin-dependent oxidoreductase [Microbacterium gorillae]|uniref:LLM class flavin-dependent oxidoreductase n=1 Tax=Microbacterium gorillae TaxID=1231063 RepID=UPI00058E3AE9|nr:LLM class flavin-dependent oxidoreductase [Microbacterium gorillae]
MRFDSGLLSHVGDIAGYPHVQEWLELPKLIESAGFTGAWSAEHHFGWDIGITPTPTNPLQWGAYVASATTTLRIGQCGVSLPAHHPLRVAEDAAMLDHMTGGRMDFGFMKGLSGKVSGNFDPAPGVPRNHDRTNGDVMWEAWDVIKKFWSGKPFRHDGEYFTFPYPWDGSKIPVDKRDPEIYAPDGTLEHLKGLPLPFQKPLPPAYTMSDSIASTERSAREGVGAFCWANTFEGTREVWAAYRRAAEESVAAGTLHEGYTHKVGMMRPCFVAETDAAAEAVMRPAINTLFANIFGSDNWLGRNAMLASYEELTPAEQAMDWYDFLLSKNQFFVGSPERMTDQLKRYEEELGARHLIMYWSMPLISFEQQKQSIRLFADKVMPNFTSEVPDGVEHLPATAAA